MLFDRLATELKVDLAGDRLFDSSNFWYLSICIHFLQFQKLCPLLGVSHFKILKKVKIGRSDKCSRISIEKLDYQNNYRAELSIRQVSIFFLAKGYKILYYRTLSRPMGKLAA